MPRVPFLSVQIAGTGHVLPETSVLSTVYDHELGLDPGTLEALTGVKARPVCRGEDQIDLAVAAAEAALQAAGMDVGALDLILGACAVPYQPIPATAPIVMARLGMAGGSAGAFDVNATCLSFLSAFEIAAAKIASGASRAALVFSSEIASRALPWATQPEVAALFGDGAAAAVLVPTKHLGTGLAAARFETWPEAWAACQISSGGTRFDYHTAPEEFAHHASFAMDGKALFRVTHRHFPDFIARLLAEAGWSPDDVDLVVPHQASPLALAHMIERTGLAPEKVVDIAADHGNQIAASIPTALDIARRDGRVAPGARVLMLGTSAGVSFGGLALVA